MRTDTQRQLAQSWLDRAHETPKDAQIIHQITGHSPSTVNRAYYSMLYAVFAILAPYSFKKRPGEDGKVIALFDRELVRSNMIPKEMSQQIHNAYDLCQAYDFQPYFEISNQQALETIRAATEFISTIEQKLSELS